MKTICRGCKRETAMTTPDGFCPSCDWEDRQGIVAWRKAYAAKKGRAR